MSEFYLSLSRLYSSLIGMDENDARHFRTLAATMQALDAHLKTIPRGFDNAR